VCSASLRSLDMGWCVEPGPHRKGDAVAALRQTTDKNTQGKAHVRQEGYVGTASATPTDDTSPYDAQIRVRTRVGECEGEPTGSPLAPPSASEARFTLRSRDPVERLVRDAVLSEKEAQLGRMFLHVTHGVQEQL
jgi:hypothetical protein